MTGPIQPIRRMRVCLQCCAMFETPHGGSWPVGWCSPECHRLSKPVPEPKPRQNLRPAVSKAKRKPVSEAEALVLQSYPPDYPLRGSKSARFLVIGNAIPYLLAVAVLRAVTRPISTTEETA